MSGLMMTLGTVDERLLHALVSRRQKVVSVLMRAVTRLGDPVVVIPLALALAFGAVPGLREEGIAGAFALTVSHLAVQALKRSVVRPRPRLPVGLSFMIEPEDRFSFPSGHAAAGLSVALPMALAVGGLPGMAVLAAGLLVGVSRCYLGVHYPGDVLVGWTLATGSAVLAGPALAAL
jgi:undecaprenyl-diphosphatase